MQLVILTQVLDREDAVLGFFHGWCAEFAAHVERLVVVAQRVGRHELPANVEVRSLGKEAGAGHAGMLRRLTATLLALRGGRRPDAILVHMVPRLVFYVAPLALPRRIPLYLWYTHKGVDRNLRLAVPLVRRVFTASEESFRLHSARDKRRVTGHGIDCAHFGPGSEPRPVDVLTVGRIAPSKGQDELLSALERLDVCPRTEIAGEILLESDVPFRTEQQRRSAAFGERVCWLGAVPWPSVAEVMRRARILVNASRTGSVDKVVLEAMACGTLPLTCNESFAPILGPELTARLSWPAGDSAALAARLVELLALPQAERVALGARLREIVVADHDLRRLVPRLVAEMEPAR